MIKHTFCLFAFVFCLHSIAVGQRSTYVGPIGALTFDKFEFTDPGNVIRTALVPSGAYGILVGQEISDHFIIELGLIRKHYSEGLRLLIQSVLVDM